ncbi:hypothetical protein HHK36_012966 [Tetracentron sinense]|uniref:GDT1 family protein n=1 Tax=Tetracentron sinense TaxID=13715 RepID=A0A834Z9W9_TETSI|nr:hypothetical protein HHK36_012966 [Tetracentron sinense]
MQGRVLHSPTISRGKLPFLTFIDSVPCSTSISRRRCSISFKFREVSRLNSVCGTIRAQASNISIGSGGYEGREEDDNQKIFVDSPPSESSSESAKPPNQIPYPLSIASVLLGCTLVFSLITFVNRGPSSLLAAIAKSGFTAAFTLIFVSEIGDKVLLGSMGALSLMTVLSVVIGRIFHSVPAQFQTTLPIGEYAAVSLLMFFGLKSIKDAWDLPSNVVKSSKESSHELGEFVEAEELVKEKVAKRLTNPFEIVWKSFSLVFFAEWGDRSMLATIALGAAQSPWGVASGAIAGHLLATFIAILGGAFLAKYISEKLVPVVVETYVYRTHSSSIRFLLLLKLMFIKLTLPQLGWLLGWSTVYCICSSHIFRSVLINIWESVEKQSHGHHTGTCHALRMPRQTAMEEMVQILPTGVCSILKAY